MHWKFNTKFKKKIKMLLKLVSVVIASSPLVEYTSVIFQARSPRFYGENMLKIQIVSWGVSCDDTKFGFTDYLQVLM